MLHEVVAPPVLLGVMVLMAVFFVNVYGPPEPMFGASSSTVRLMLVLLPPSLEAWMVEPVDRCPRDGTGGRTHAEGGERTAVMLHEVVAPPPVLLGVMVLMAVFFVNVYGPP